MCTCDCFCIYACILYDFVPEGVHGNRTIGVENNVACRLKLDVFLEYAQCEERFLESKR